MAYIEEDERVEVTPKSIRLRKAILDPNDRKRAERKAGAGRLEASASALHLPSRPTLPPSRGSGP